MTEGDYARVLQNPRFRELTRERSNFAIALSIAILAIYLGFILLVAFAKGLLAMKVGGGVTSLGILLGVGVILAAWVLTGIYVRRANGRFDALTRNLMEEIER